MLPCLILLTLAILEFCLPIEYYKKCCLKPYFLGIQAKKTIFKFTKEFTGCRIYSISQGMNMLAVIKHMLTHSSYFSGHVNYKNGKIYNLRCYEIQKIYRLVVLEFWKGVFEGMR